MFAHRRPEKAHGGNAGGGGNRHSTSSRLNQYARSHTETTKRGTFKDGTWSCECSPPLPAQRFQVKKEGKNNGRWFYTCQKPKNEGCGFFLWEDDASKRMEAAVLGANPTKPEYPNEDPPTKKRKLPWLQDEAVVSDKRVAMDGGRENSRNSGTEQTHKSPLESNTEVPKALSKTTEQTDTNAGRELRNVKGEMPITPHKPHPQGESKVQNGLPTPNTTSTSRYAVSDRKKALELSEDPFTTPTPARFRDVNLESPATAPSPSGSEPELLSSILEILSASQPPIILSSRTKDSLRETIRRHEAKSRGYLKGRDVARQVIRERDGRIAEMNKRIHDLEGQVESLKCIREMDQIDDEFS